MEKVTFEKVGKAAQRRTMAGNNSRKPQHIVKALKACRTFRLSYPTPEAERVKLRNWFSNRANCGGKYKT